MARSDGPPNGLDHPPQNGHRAKQVAIALFIATTFGIMAILSFPLSGVRGPLRLPRPLQAALSPFERLIRPVVPWVVRPAPPRLPPTIVALGPQPRRPIAPQGPAGPPTGPLPQPPGQPPPGGGQPPPPPGTVMRTARVRLSTFIRELTLLSHRTTKPSPEQIRRIRKRMSVIRSLRSVCVADPVCAKLLKRAEKLFRKLEARWSNETTRSHHGKKHRRGGESTSRSEGGSRDRKHRGHGHGRGHGRTHKHTKHHGHKGHGGHAHLPVR
jgi:hypothetical protein